MKINLGILLVWKNRLQSYISFASPFMLFYIFIQENKWLQWYEWIFFGVMFAVLATYSDIKYIFPKQQEYTSVKNPEWNKLRNDVKEIKQILQEKNESIIP